jgi:hypothetical protein
MLMLSIAGCSQDLTSAVDSCSWVKPITLTRPIVRGSDTFADLSDDDRLALFESERDNVTQATAGQIVTLNRAFRRSRGHEGE